jgi:hypothetical protein
VSATHALDVEVRLYDRLFNSEQPGASHDYKADLNPSSLEVLTHAKLEPSVAGAAPARATSSSGSAISASIPTRRPARSSSTAP